MVKDWKYILYLGLAAAFYMFVQLTGPREINWVVTYHRADKNPFGGYVLNELVKGIFPEDEIYQSNMTAYELIDSVKSNGSFLSISTRFGPGKEDAETLLDFADRGGHVLIAAQEFDGIFADTLNLQTSDYLFDYGRDIFDEYDSVAITLTYNHQPEFYYQRKSIYNYFNSYDTARTSIMAYNDVDYPVLVGIDWGKGKLFLSTTPIAFTNISLLNGNNYEFAEQALSALPEGELYWTEFYHLGRLEAETPLRFILSSEPLKWAYYISIISLLIFILFEIKRKQRIIPVIKPLQNTTLEFVGTVGNLYYQSKDHKNIAEKRISFLSEQLRVKHGFNMLHVDEQSIVSLANKTGNDEKTVRELIDIIARIQSSKSITEDELLLFNEKLEKFNH
jgi:hypothetical protein